MSDFKIVDQLLCLTCSKLIDFCKSFFTRKIAAAIRFKYYVNQIPSIRGSGIVLQEQSPQIIIDRMTSSTLHRYIYFYQGETSLAFAASTSGSALVIERATGAFSLQCTTSMLYCSQLILVLNTNAYPPPQTIYGIIGLIQLRLGNRRSYLSLIPDTYVILITGRESIGHLTSHEIWRLTKFEIVPLRLAKGNSIQVSSLSFKLLILGP